VRRFILREEAALYRFNIHHLHPALRKSLAQLRKIFL
jgi:hypothetical protein